MVRSQAEFLNDSETMHNLRLRAEQRLKTGGKRDVVQMSAEEIAATIHELETHRIELEMQNEELRQAQHRLIEARDRYTELYDFAPTGYVTLTQTGRIVQANLTLARMLGVARDLLLNQPFSVYVACEDQDLYYTHRREAFETGARHSCELQLRPQGGRELWAGLESVVACTQPAEGAVLRMVVCDITERKLAAGERERMEALLRQAQKMQSLGLLVGRVAHDFNNLLQIINGYADIALANTEPRNIAFGSIDEIAKAGGVAKEMVQQLLSFSRPHKADPVPVDLNEMIEQSKNMLGRLIGETVQFRLVTAEEQVMVSSDQGQLQQMLMNLCVNARDAMPDGGILTVRTENVRIRPTDLEVQTWARSGVYAVLSVTDTGCGIDEQIMDRIFDPFFTTKKAGRGTGLGLFTVDGIVKQNDGHIELCSELNKGTTVKIYLPAAPAS